MRKTFSSTIAGLTIGLIAGLVATPLAAIADEPDEPISDAYATQDPIAYGGLALEPCETRRSVDCYWDAIGQTGEWGRSYYAIRVGKQVCIKYWDAKYDRKHGRCKALPKNR
jgi:hypothetical protein